MVSVLEWNRFATPDHHRHRLPLLVHVGVLAPLSVVLVVMLASAISSGGSPAGRPRVRAGPCVGGFHRSRGEWVDPALMPGQQKKTRLNRQEQPRDPLFEANSAHEFNQRRCARPGNAAGDQDDGRPGAGQGPEQGQH